MSIIILRLDAKFSFSMLCFQILMTRLMTAHIWKLLFIQYEQAGMFVGVCIRVVAISFYQCTSPDQTALITVTVCRPQYQCLNCRGGLGGWTPNCFLNPLTHCQIMYRGSAICYIHTIYITILVGLRLSSSQLPANFSQFKHWEVLTLYKLLLVGLSEEQ